MPEKFYFVSFIASLFLTGIYMFLWHKKYDVHLTLIFALIPIVNLGYLLLANADSENAALAAYKIIYVGGCFLQLIIMLAVFSLCQIRVKRWVRILFMAFSTVVYLSVLTIGSNSLFYTHYHMEHNGGVHSLVREYGVMHSVFYGLVVGYFLLSLGAIIYALLRKNQVSRRILVLLFIPVVVCMSFYFAGKIMTPHRELVPAAYVFAQIMYLLIVYRISLYDVTETAMEAIAQSGSTGLVSFDLDRNYLGSNRTAKRILPGLRDLTVDLGLSRSSELNDLISPWLDDFDRHPDDPDSNRHFYEKDGRIYLFVIQHLPGRGSDRNIGYQVFITDDTLDRAYIKLIDEYNSDLEEQVAEKTAHIVEMHDNLVLSMATMVESRDNSTGGHIRRTSEGVRILTDTMKQLPAAPEGYELSDEFCRDLIKAAPMHDLGKIAVDDAILRKPGRFTPEEFEVMKTHAAEGARIVHEILKATDDYSFHILAENVAHYHHERWDGSGYPEGLKGKQIPPEARIMAIADVYDALVSKRVYKEKMSFEKADSIILEGMGSQFDPALEEAYKAARPKLEAYYANADADGQQDADRHQGLCGRQSAGGQQGEKYVHAH